MQYFREHGKAICEKHGEHIAWRVQSESCLACKKCKNDIMKWRRVNRHLQTILADAKCRSKRHGREFSLTEEIVMDILKKQNYKCAISGLTFYNDKVSIDRIDSTKGYTKENTQVVRHNINIMKNKLGMTEFLELCRIIAENNPRSGSCQQVIAEQ